MEIHFTNDKTRKLFEDEKELRRSYGEQQARRIQNCLAMLRAAATLHDLRAAPNLHAHMLAGDRAGQIALSLRQPYRLIVLPVHPGASLPQDDAGGLDWAAIRAVCVLEITDYH